MSAHADELANSLEIVIRHRFQRKWLKPNSDDRWTDNPRDAGLWSEASARQHILANQARVYQPLEKAIREYRCSLSTKGQKPQFQPPF